MLPPLPEGEPHDCEVAMSHILTPCPDLQNAPLMNPDLILFVDGSYCKQNKKISKLAMLLLPNMNSPI